MGLRRLHVLAENDPDLLSLRSEIALLDVRLIDVLRGRGDEGQPRATRPLRAALRRLRRVLSAQDHPSALLALADAERALAPAAAEREAWRDVRSMLQERVKLVEAERRRMLDLQQYITAEQAQALITRIISILKQHVTDREALASLSHEFRRLIAS